MGTHPVFLCLAGRRCVVLGGDDQAATKALACRHAGAEVTVVATELVPGLRDEVARGGMAHVARAYRPGDLAGACSLIVFLPMNEKTSSAAAVGTFIL
jgi:siroheme synthase (precorrin-2 oxidase/ferrochelatase)